MAHNKYFIVWLFFLCNAALAFADDTSSCYKIEPWTIAGIVFADVILTLILIALTYRCASIRREKVENVRRVSPSSRPSTADKVYMNVRANCKK